MLIFQVIGAAPGSENTIDWPAVWRDSPERRAVKQTLTDMKEKLSLNPVVHDETSLRPFAVSSSLQLRTVVVRLFEQYWRTPSYLYSKTLLCTVISLFIGFSFFNAGTSQQGLQNQLFSIFMLLSIFGNLVQQIMPHFCTQRALYEVRERPSKAYSWKVFIVSNILVELPWNSLMAVIMFVCFYYPIGMYKNAEPTDAVNERGLLMFFFIWTFMLFTSTFADMVIAGIANAETGGNVAQLIFSVTLIFCGVLATPAQFPHFWIFLYRLSPFTYLIAGMMSTGLANTAVVCSDIEYLHFDPPSGQTCAAYMSGYIKFVGGYLTNGDATSDCRFCAVAETNVFLAQIGSYYDQAWRNFGIMWGFIVFNIIGAVFMYWLVRVPKNSGRQKKE